MIHEGSAMPFESAQKMEAESVQTKPVEAGPVRPDPNPKADQPLVSIPEQQKQLGPNYERNQRRKQKKLKERLEKEKQHQNNIENQSAGTNTVVVAAAADQASVVLPQKNPKERGPNNSNKQRKTRRMKRRKNASELYLQQQNQQVNTEQLVGVPSVAGAAGIRQEEQQQQQQSSDQLLVMPQKQRKGRRSKNTKRRSNKERKRSKKLLKQQQQEQQQQEQAVTEEETWDLTSNPMSSKSQVGGAETMLYASLLPLYFTLPAAVITQIRSIVSSSSIIGVSMQGNLDARSRASLIQISAAPSTVIVLDLHFLHKSPPVKAALKELLENVSIVKVFYGLGKYCDALSGQFGINVVNAFDIEVGYQVLSGTTEIVDMDVVLDQYTAEYELNDHNDPVLNSPVIWQKRPLKRELIKYAVQFVIYFPEAYVVMREQLKEAGILSEGERQMKNKVDVNSGPGRKARPPTTKQMSIAIKNCRGLLAESKDGAVSVTGLRQFESFRGVPQVVPLNAVRKSFITISNHSDNIQILTEIPEPQVLRNVAFTVDLDKVSELPLMMLPKSSITLPVTFLATTVGIHNAVFRFGFGGGDGVSIFAELRCGDPTVAKMLKPKSRFVWVDKKHRTPKPHLVIKNGQVPGRGIKKSTGVRPLPMKQFTISKEWENICESNATGQELKALGDLSLNNYKDKMTKLLWTEEVEERESLGYYGINRTILENTGGFLLKLLVPGMAESRPSVLIGDSVLVRHVVTDDGTNSKTKQNKTKRDDIGELEAYQYRGYVHHTTRDHAYLRFHADFHRKYRDTPVSVDFELNRSSYRSMHQCLEYVSKPGTAIKPLIFPDHEDIHLQPARPHTGSLTVHTLPDATNQLNDEQARVVLNVVQGRARCVPYVIYGPPGTGKSSTLVACVRNLFLASQNRHGTMSTHVLCLAPTNAAADIFVERLRDLFGVDAMFRATAYSRRRSQVSPDVLPYCYFSEEEDHFILPAMHELMQYTVVVATLSMAAKFVNQRVPKGHFSFFAIDEAGNALEPSAIAPVVTLADLNTCQVVVAGDPKQLSAVVHSKTAEKNGLAVSYLERLMNRSIYQPRSSCNPKNDEIGSEEGTKSVLSTGGPDAATLGYNPLVVTKLVRNYRSHADLFQVSNELFYDSDLIASAPLDVVNQYTTWDKLPAHNVPLIMHGVKGKEMREANSPSFFNIDEATQVLAYVEELMSGFNGVQVSPADIGVIAPYHKQKTKLRELFQASQFPEVKVGSAEEFQGQERLVIIVSTVRSSTTFFDHDLKHNLGFVASPTRMNVALTRAKALMIVVGNPNVLAADSNWLAFLRFCEKKGACVGVRLEMDVGDDKSNPIGEDVDEISDLLKSLYVDVFALL